MVKLSYYTCFPMYVILVVPFMGKHAAYLKKVQHVKHVYIYSEFEIPRC